MERYQIITSIEDMGPYVSKLILHMPCEVQCAEISEQSFNIYVERRDIVTGEVIVSKSFETRTITSAPLYGRKLWLPIPATLPEIKRRHLIWLPLNWRRKPLANG